MNDLEENEIRIDDDHYVGAPNQCKLCELWQVDMVFRVPQDRASVGEMFRAAGEALTGATRLMAAYIEHMREDHKDEEFIQGLERGLRKNDGSSSPD
jgi:hypothetical protein